MKPDNDGMELVLEAFKKYLKSIEKFQSGDKIDIPSNDLQRLESELFSKNPQKSESVIDPNHKSNSFNIFIQSINKVELNSGVIPYSLITELIYEEMQLNRELYDTLKHTMDSDWETYLQYNPQVKKETTRIFLKIKEHIGLSIIQSNHINDRLNKKVNSTLDKLDETENSLKELFVEIDKIEEDTKKKSDQIVVNFITILGIFAAIMMGTVGAFQGFTTMFSNANNVPVGKILLISSTGASVLSLIMFLLIYSISKLTTIKFSNCNCDKKRVGVVARIQQSFLGLDSEDVKPKCTCSPFNKYPAIILINYVFYYIGVTGLTFIYFNSVGNSNFSIWQESTHVVLIYLLFTLLILFLHRNILNKKSNVALFKQIKNNSLSLKSKINFKKKRA